MIDAPPELAWRDARSQKLSARVAESPKWIILHEAQRETLRHEHVNSVLSRRPDEGAAEFFNNSLVRARHRDDYPAIEAAPLWIVRAVSKAIGRHWTFLAMSCGSNGTSARLPLACSHLTTLVARSRDNCKFTVSLPMLSV